MIWRNLKDRIINLFYKEVEVEEDEKSQRTNNLLYDAEKYRMSSLEDESKDVRVRYQYPQKETGPFRFPVIPDRQDSSIRQNHTSRSNNTKNGGSLRSSAMKQQVTLSSHKNETATSELDEVPAFMRRGRLQQKSRSTEYDEEKPIKDDKPLCMEILPHTKPEELDAFFKKRDGKTQPLEEKEPVFSYETDESVQEKENLEQEEAPTKQFVLRETVVNGELNDDVHEETAATFPDHTEHVDEKMSKEITPKKSFVERAPIDEKSKASAPKYEFHHMPQNDIVEEQTSHPVPEYLLNDHPNESATDEDWLIEQQILLEDTFTHFNIDATVMNVTQGPSVTRFEIQPALGVKVSKIKNLSDDLKLNLAAEDIRIEAPIPGRNTIGIEIPNKTMHLVNLQDLFETESFKEAESPLTVALGLTIEGEPIITNIDKMPHGLIAGATGSGKSVCINTIILSLLYKAHHNDVKLLLVDPKMVELTPYNNIPHLIAPVITNVKAATKALKWAVDEMEDRYQKFVELGVRNIQKFNEKINQEQTSYERMPYIVIIIDELADLMMVSPQEVEDAICRIAQKARACGIHLLLATQRPSVDVITGLIKANIPTRIAFSVSSQVDSRTMIDSNGAEKLLGKGDMLFVENGAGKAARLQGPFVSDEEIDRVATYVRSIAEPKYLFEEEQLLTYANEEDADELLEEVVSFVIRNEQASTSLLQRQFRIGYNRAARLIDSLEAKEIISGQNGSKPREVLVTEEQIEYI